MVARSGLTFGSFLDGPRSRLLLRLRHLPPEEDELLEEDELELELELDDELDRDPERERERERERPFLP